jgi:oligopeptide transport system substrate-binding protein
LYIKKRWILLFLVVVIGVAIGYIYMQFFHKNEADKVCCKKHYIDVPSVLTITESTPIPILDSSKANQQITYNILNQVQEGLMRLGPNDIPVLGLAESYQVSPDYRTYTFTIRKNAVWSDGKPVTANDFKFAWERALNPANQYEYAFLFYPIHNAQSYSLGKVSAEQIGVIATDDKQLTIQLDKPDPNFLSLVTLTPFLPMRSDLVEKYGDNYATSPETMSFTGPFQLQSFTPQKANLIKNPNYWDKSKVKLLNVAMNVEVDQSKQKEFYQSESSAMIKLNSRELKNFTKSPQLLRVQKSKVDFIEMNQKREIFKNENIRRAIQFAVNNSEIAQEMNDGSTSADSVVPLSMIKEKPEWIINGNSKQAELLLDKGIKELNRNGLPVLEITTYNLQHFISVANIVKKQLERIGMKVSIKKYDTAQKSKSDSVGEYDLSVSQWASYYNKPEDNLKLWSSKDGRNISGFQNNEYDFILTKIDEETNLAKRDQLLQEAEKYLIVDKAVVMPLVYVNDLRLQKPYVKNVLYHPFGADYSLKWATYQPPKQIEATK